MNCFVLRVDGVLCVGLCCLLSVTVLGQVGGAPGLRGRHRASPTSARAASPPRPCLAHTYVAQRWVVHQPVREGDSFFALSVELV